MLFALIFPHKKVDIIENIPRIVLRGLSILGCNSQNITTLPLSRNGFE
jgi:hypothetical protein